MPNNFLFLIALLTLAAPATINYSFVISWFVPTVSPDGFSRAILGINEQSPGPTIEATVGDTVIVKVTNLGTEGTSIHWHGILMQNQNEMDGPAFVTQCPIPVGKSMNYKFTLINQTGTYWYHAHNENQYVDGVRGAFIIYAESPDDEPYDYIQEEIVQLSDWYHHISSNLFTYYDSPASGGNEPVPDNVLINGIGQNYCGLNCEFATFRLNKQKSTRFRIINSSAFAVVHFSIDNHTLFVIETDGHPVRLNDTVDDINAGMANSTLTHLRINIGQRYSVLVFPIEGVDTGLDNTSYWMRVVMEDVNFYLPAPFNMSRGIISYGTPTIPNTVDNPISMLSSVPCPICTDANDLIPLYPVPPPEPDLEETLVLLFFSNTEGVNVAHFNNISCTLPYNTSLLSLLQAGVPFPNPFFSCANYSLPLNTVVRLIINNHDTGEHPIHLHGHFLWILAEGPPGAGDYNPSIPLDLETPLIRDTVTVNFGSYLVIEFVANNPGVWLMHCHINWHMMVGLGAIWEVGSEEVVQRLGSTDGVQFCNTTSQFQYGSLLLLVLLQFFFGW